MKLPTLAGLTVFLMMVLLGAGCSMGSGVESSNDLTAYFGKQWSLASFNGVAAPVGEYVIFESAERYSARFCNSMGGSFALSDGTFKSTSTISTLMACTDERGAIEQAFSQNLSGGLEMKIDDTVMTLEGVDGSKFEFTLNDTSSVSTGTP